ncbi:hypothetical protein LU11_gp131 [Pseudomonas phage Lu11]|uniref:hypothetical protein n=1 Tax=Pseudomonas phage Lu11 TaxID=1161927 RepID=UPI00025F17A8|nr:hypothetical protein LU11_gp131 [Pseudomonas phage Lu11]AFH14662.1 hypothetical protein Lu11_0129A [Pseudomonas phage Lu11]
MEGAIGTMVGMIVQCGVRNEPQEAQRFPHTREHKEHRLIEKEMQNKEPAGSLQKQRSGAQRRCER